MCFKKKFDSAKQYELMEDVVGGEEVVSEDDSEPDVDEEGSLDGTYMHLLVCFCFY